MSKHDYPLQNRELSWLAFNERVLLEARNPGVPLLERLKFIAIFSANLDEYFKVRVATMRRLVKLKRKTRARLAADPAEELRLVLERVTELQHAFGQTFREDIRPALAVEGIDLLTDDDDFTSEQRAWVTRYAHTHVRPLLAGATALDQVPGPLF